MDGFVEGGECETIGDIGKEFVAGLYGAPAIGVWSADGGVWGDGVMRRTLEKPLQEIKP